MYCMYVLYNTIRVHMILWTSHECHHVSPVRFRPCCAITYIMYAEDFKKKKEKKKEKRLMVLRKSQILYHRRLRVPKVFFPGSPPFEAQALHLAAKRWILFPLPTIPLEREPFITRRRRVFKAVQKRVEPFESIYPSRQRFAVRSIIFLWCLEGLERVKSCCALYILNLLSGETKINTITKIWFLEINQSLTSPIILFFLISLLQKVLNLRMRSTC